MRRPELFDVIAGSLIFSWGQHIFNPSQGSNGAWETQGRNRKVADMTDGLWIDARFEGTPNMAVYRALKPGADCKRQLDFMVQRSSKWTGCGAGPTKFLIGFP